jgi:hypothetical protein
MCPAALEEARRLPFTPPLYIVDYTYILGYFYICVLKLLYLCALALEEAMAAFYAAVRRSTSTSTTTTSSSSSSHTHTHTHTEAGMDRTFSGGKEKTDTRSKSSGASVSTVRSTPPARRQPAYTLVFDAEINRGPY